MYWLAILSDASADLLRQAAISAAAGEAEKTLIARYDFYWAVASAVATILLIGITFLGLGAWKNVKAGIKSEVSNEVRAELLGSSTFKRELVDAARSDVAEEFERKSLRLERQIQLSKLQYLSTKVSQSSNFSHAEREALYGQLTALRDDPEIIRDVDYINSLEQVLDSFYEASLWGRMDDLEDNMGHIMAEHPGMVQTMAMAYAVRIFGEVSDDDDTKRRFHKYVELLQEHKISFLAIQLKLAAELAKPSPDHKTIQRLKDDYEDLDDEMRAFGLKGLEQFCDPSLISKNPKNWHGRIASKFRMARDILVSGNAKKSG